MGTIKAKQRINIARFTDDDGNQLIEMLEDTELFGIKIPKGFISDGASVPSCLHWFMSPFGDAIYAAVVHDFQLHSFRRISKRWRRKADRHFRKNLSISSDCGKVRLWLTYLGVRLWSNLYVTRHVNHKCNRRKALFRKKK